MALGWESYNFLLFAKGNKAAIVVDEFGDSMVEIVGEVAFAKSFAETLQIISSVPNVIPYTPPDLYSFQNPRCYFCFTDGNCIIEIEVNNGELSEIIEEISIRFAVSNPKDTFDKTIMLCKLLANLLSLDVYDMRLKQTLDFTNEIQTLASKKCFIEKRKILLPDETISVPLHCGRAFWDWIRRQK